MSADPAEAGGRAAIHDHRHIRRVLNDIDEFVLEKLVCCILLPENDVEKFLLDTLKNLSFNEPEEKVFTEEDILEFIKKIQ